MTHAAFRLLRADVEEFDADPPKLSKRRQEQRDRIFRIVPRLLARRGTATVTLPALALALDIGTASLRRHVIDRDYLLFKILVAFLQSLAGETPAEPALHAAATILWHRDRPLLPPDLQESLETLRATLRIPIPPRDEAHAAAQAPNPSNTHPAPTHLAPAHQPAAPHRQNEPPAPPAAKKGARRLTTRQLALRVFAATARQPDLGPRLAPLSPSAIPSALRPGSPGQPSAGQPPAGQSPAELPPAALPVAA